MNEKSWTLAICSIVFLTPSSHSHPTSSVAENLSLPMASADDAAAQNQMGALPLPDGSKFQTTLYNLKVVGQLRAIHKLPYFVLSGVGCSECDANVSIYIHSPSDGPMKDEGSQRRFDFPGRILSRQNHSVLSETRMFLGSCAIGHSDAVVWFQRWIGDDRHWHESVSLAEIKDDRLVFGEPKANMPRLGETEDAVRKSKCREISGIDQYEEP